MVKEHSKSIRPLRAKTVELRRQHILEAAVAVFSERGFHRSTIRDVARAAGISDGAIYTVFANKEALLFGMLDPLGDSSAVSQTPKPAGEFLRESIHRRWQTFTPQTLPMLRVVLSEVLVDRKLRALFMKRVITPALELPVPHFEALTDAGELTITDVGMTMRIMTGALLGLLVLRLLGDETLNTRTDEMPGALADLLLTGLSPRSY